MTKTAKGGGSARMGVVLFALAALMSFGVGLTLAAPPFTTTIAVDDVTEFTVTVSGVADSPSQATHYMVIDWGDGDEDTLPTFDSDAPWNWGPLSHTYDAAGTYTITATLIHAQEQGNDKGSASASTEATVPGGCVENCPTDDDGATDDGADDDGATDDGGEVPTEVQGKTITKKPVVKGTKLAKTGPENTGLIVVALMLLMGGATIRLLTTREDEAIVAASARDDR